MSAGLKTHLGLLAVSQDCQPFAFLWLRILAGFTATGAQRVNRLLGSSDWTNC